MHSFDKILLESYNIREIKEMACDHCIGLTIGGDFTPSLVDVVTVLVMLTKSKGQ